MIQRKPVYIASISAYLAVSIATSNAGENRWTTAGPYGGPTPQIYFDPGNPSVAYALGLNALYKSTDGGANWIELSFSGDGAPVSGIAIDPTRPGRLYAASAAGLFRSDDSGANFQKLSVPGRPQGVGSQPAPINVSSSQSGATLHVTMTMGAPFVSTDAGASFNARGQSNSPFGVRIHPTNEALFYALGGPSELEVSTDAGNTWITRATPAINKLDLAVTTDGTSTVWVASVDGISMSTDNGVTYTQSLPLSFPWLSQDPNAASILYAGSARAAGPVYLYANGNWLQLPGPLPAAGHRIAQPNLGANTLLASDGVGLHRSNDGGTTWIRSDQGITNWRVLTLSASQSRVFVGATSTEFAWTDDSATWNRASLPINNLFAGAVRAIAADPTNADLVLAGTGGGGLFRSTDRGAHWTEVSVGLPGSASTDVLFDTLAFDPSSPDIVYGTYGKNLTTQVMRSIDRGASFGIVSEDLPPLQHVTTLLVNGHKPGHVLLAGTDFQQLNGLFRSTDGGAHWTQVINGGGTADVTVDATNGNRLYASSAATALKVSDDAGATWIPSTTFDTNTLGFTDAVKADPKRSGTVYALARRFVTTTTTYHLLRSVDAGLTWETIDAPSVPHWQPDRIALAPNSPSIVYVSVFDRSVYSFEIAPDLLASIQGHTGQRTVNTASQFTVNVHNNSPLAASDVALTINLPASVQNASGSVPNGQCSTQTNVIQCTIPFVRTGQDVAATVNYTPTVVGSIDVSTSVSARERDPATGNNSASATATAVNAPPANPPSSGGGGSGGGALSVPLLLFLSLLQLARTPRRL